jgi:hypothetical protein
MHKTIDLGWTHFGTVQLLRFALLALQVGVAVNCICLLGDIDLKRVVIQNYHETREGRKAQH